jgi:hypothetical protein
MQSYLQSKLEAVGPSAVGVLSTLLGNQLGWIEMGADAMVAFVLGASGAAGGYIVKESFNWISKKVKSRK